MSIQQELKEEEEPRFVPRVITGGKGPPDDPNNPDWLSGLPIKTTILIQGKKDTNFSLGQATVLFKGKKGVMLLIIGQSKEPVWVDPVRFCSLYRNYEVLQTAEEYELEQTLNEHNRSYQQGSMANSAETLPVDQVNKDV